MKYVIKAVKNPCGTVDGMWCIRPSGLVSDWVRLEAMKADVGMTLNEAYGLLENTVKIHIYKCQCDFEVVEAFDGWKIK